MNDKYHPDIIEPQVQKYWEDNRSFEVTEDPTREKFYCLSMFPYPSGKLHMGHVRNYTIGDVISRYQRMRGKNVLQPMGWDAFGLPAENAAIKNKVPPAQWTYANIEAMKDQLKQLGFGYDWSREVTTCRPEYYRWEQWFFTRLMQKGLVYRKNATVNWDPVDQTVLANEQVIDGRGWRSGAPVERREIPQWFMKITDYADELLAGIDDLTGWPDAVRTMQRNWIGRSEGVEIDFAVDGSDTPLRVYTTRPDTLMGVTYMAVAAEHPLAIDAAARDEAVAAFVAECKRSDTSEAALETMEKKGMRLGVDAIHPVSGERVPVLVANFVLMGYGTGAVMSVPGHDERDWAFARKYDLPIKQVIEATDGTEVDVETAAYVDKGVCVNSGILDGMDYEQAFETIARRLEQAGAGERKTNYRLRDWGVSRQRYWGAPIPVINVGEGRYVPVPEGDLPVRLPEDVAFEGVGSPLHRMPEFLETTDPATGNPARRETDTFDTFMESSWYYARYTSPGCDEAMLDERARYWLPVDQYIGGIEHATLHLLYVRYYHKLLRDEGLVDGDEPIANLLTQGMVNAATYYREEDGRKVYFSPTDVTLERDDRGQVTSATLTSDGRPVTVGGFEKMSKSKNTGIDPAALIERHGADTVRLYVMFAGPPDQSLEWSDEAVEGAFRFHRKLWRAVSDHVARGAPPALDADALDDDVRKLRRQVHETIAKVSDDVGRRYAFNAAIASMMELLNALTRVEAAGGQSLAVVREGYRAIVAMLSPISPHITHVLWQALGETGAVVDARWPSVDEAALERQSLEIVVQVNGKLRGRVSVDAAADRETVEAAALADDNVQRFVRDATIRKIVVVPGKLVNVVTG